MWGEANTFPFMPFLFCPQIHCLVQHHPSRLLWPDNVVQGCLCHGKDSQVEECWGDDSVGPHPSEQLGLVACFPHRTCTIMCMCNNSTEIMHALVLECSKQDFHKETLKLNYLLLVPEIGKHCMCV